MWHHNKKNPMEVNAPQPAKPTPPAKLNATAQANKPTSTIKLPTPEIRVGLGSIGKLKGMNVENPARITKIKKMKNLPKRANRM